MTGDARLTVDFDTRDVDVAFTGIAERGAGRAIVPMRSEGLAMADGAVRGTGIEGRFYGSAHQEAGGVFDHNSILGAFGARRQ